MRIRTVFGVMLVVSLVLAVGCGGDDPDADYTSSCQSLLGPCAEQPHLNDLFVFGEDATSCGEGLDCLVTHFQGECGVKMVAVVECLAGGPQDDAGCQVCDDHFLWIDKNCDAPEACRELASR